MATPIPYGFGGVIPGGLGGNPILPDINGFSAGVGNAGRNFVPGGNLQQLVNQLDLTPTGPYSPYPRVVNGFQGFGGVPELPITGPSSPFPRALSEVPVSIRTGGGASFDAGLVSKLGGEAAAAESVIPKASGLLARTKSRLPFVEGGVGLKGFAKGAVVPLIASVALNKAGQMAGGDESFLGRALKGAGTGSIGFALGPEIGIPTTIAGAALNAFFGGKQDDKNPVWLEDDVLNRAGFGDEDKAQIKLTYDILKETQGKEQANLMIGQLIMQDITNRQAQKQQDEASQRRMLATQEIAARYFQPFTKQMLDSAQQRYMVSESVAADLPKEYRSVMRAQNVAALDNARNVASAYATQAQLIPMSATIDYQKSIADQLSQQQAASVIQGLYGGATAGGGGSLTDLASQLGLQNAGG